MKRASIFLSVLLASSVCGFCADKTPLKGAKSTPPTSVKARKHAPKPASPERVALTGSYIKQDIHRNGIVTDSANPVVVLDNEMIRNSGAADLRQLLVLRGLSR